MSARKGRKSVVAVKSAANNVANAFEKSVGPATETFERMKLKVANQMENTMQNASEQMDKVNREFMGRMEEVSSFNRNNMEAFMRAANIMADGMKDISQAMFNTMQSNMENTMATTKAMMGVKTMRDLVELQSQYVKNAFDQAMSESTKLSEMTVRYTSEAAEPISNRVNDVVQNIASRKAA
jgi:phasin family protein